MISLSRNRVFVLMPWIIVALAKAQIISLSGTVADSYSLLPVDSARIDIVLVNGGSAPFTVYTSTAGVWSLVISSAHDDHGNDQFPHSFDVHQNFPNPFNPATTLSFSIPDGGPVDITVHNILGQSVGRRAYTLSPGSYSVQWNGGGAAGTYFYTIRHHGRSYTRKMVQSDGNNGSGELGDARLTGGIASSLKKITAADVTIIVSKFGYEKDTVTYPLESINNNPLSTPLTTIHRRAFVIDLHNDVAELMVDGYQLGVRHTSNHSDIPRFRDGGVDAQMMVLWSDPSDFAGVSYQRTIQMYDTCMAQIGRNSGSIAKATTVAEIQSANKAGKLAAIFCAEGGHAIEEDIGKLADLYHRGARYLTITWNNSLSWAIAAADAQSATKGLNDFGRQVIRAMDSLGMIIDVSHTGIKTIEDILATTKNPIIASHSGVRALRNHTRNLTDDQIKAIAKGGGVIGIVFYTSFISSAPRSSVTIDTVVKHIDYIKNLVGIDHIAVGSDYDGGITTPVGLEDVSKLGNLTMALLRKGYSSADVRKILGENYLRVFEAVCK